MVSVATALLRRRGYRGTTMSEVGRACGLLKGSLYSYFASKEDLAIAAMRRVSDYFQEHIFPIASLPDLTPAQKLSQISVAILEYFARFEGGCLLANLALEAMDLEPEFQPLITKYFKDWISAYANIYASAGYSSEDSFRKGQDAVARIQGALLLRKILLSQEPLQIVISDISSSL